MRAVFWVVILGGVGFAAWLFLKKNPDENAFLARELATEGLADYLAKKYPGQHAIIVSNPYTQRKGLEQGVYDQEEAGIRGVRKGFDHRITLEAVAFPDLKPEAERSPQAVEIDAGSTTPLSFLVAEDAFDKLARQHPGCGLIVSLIGLPVNLSRVEAWQTAGKPMFALLLPDLRFVGDATAIQAAVKTEKLAAFVLNKPGAPPEQTPLRKNRKEEFERRYVLVTSDNIDQILQSYPRLFDFSGKSPR